MGKAVDITGQKFGRLTAIKRVGTDRLGNALWLFICDCGNEHTVAASCVRNGGSKSCGCLAREASVRNWKTYREASKKVTVTHGLSGKRIYNIWKSMVSRCHNPKNIGWHRYGGRGITVCDEWRNDPLRFTYWAMHNGYTDILTIDRIDGNAGYCSENCRWVSTKDQSNNRSSNRLVTINNETKTVQQWAELSEIGKSTLIYRLDHGWNPEEAICIKPIPGGSYHASTS